MPILIRRPSWNTSLAAVLMASAIGLFAPACGTTVKRIQTTEVVDLSGRWNDSDSRFVSEEMIKDCLSHPWLDDAQSGKKKPIVTIGRVKNKSSEHINTQTFVNDLRRAMINSGRITVVADKEQRGELRQEREEQAVYAAEKTQKAPGQELGADFMLQGVINTIEDREGNEAVAFYQVDMELLNVEDNSLVWTGQKKIKKFIERTNTRY
jgi:penicillin-binding protein activator